MAGTALSGRHPDPNSERTRKGGRDFVVLPVTGYDGGAPAWPLPDTESIELGLAEQTIWEELWRTPQAFAWAQPGEQWRLRQVALYARTLARCETFDAPAGLLAQLERMGDRIGLSKPGLALNGWSLTVAEKASPTPAAAANLMVRRGSARDRLTRVK